MAGLQEGYAVPLGLFKPRTMKEACILAFLLEIKLQ